MPRQRDAFVERLLQSTRGTFEMFSICSVEWMMYGWSVLHCLPVGKADTPSAETGTVMRPSTLERYAQEAGFRRVEILSIDNLFFRFYRLYV